MRNLLATEGVNLDRVDIELDSTDSHRNVGISNIYRSSMGEDYVTKNDGYLMI
jgi:hypothetical protein